MPKLNVSLLASRRLAAAAYVIFVLAISAVYVYQNTMPADKAPKASSVMQDSRAYEVQVTRRMIDRLKSRHVTSIVVDTNRNLEIRKLLSDRTNLREVKFESPVGDNDLIALANNKSLAKLTITVRSHDIGAAGLSALATMTQIRDLTIRAAPSTNSTEGDNLDVTPILLSSRSLVRLERLYVWGGSTSDVGLLGVVEHPLLTKIGLAYMHIPPGAIRLIGKLRSPSELNLSSIGITDDDICSFPSWPSLAVIELTNNPISDLGVECLTRFQNLEYIGLSGTDITTNSTNIILSCQRLSKIELPFDLQDRFRDLCRQNHRKVEINH